MPKTRKPCPACGEKICREAGTICWQCLDYIAKGKEAEKKEVRRKSVDKYNIAEGHYWPLYKPAHDVRVDEVIDRIRQAVSNALCAVAEPTAQQGGYGGEVDKYLPYHDCYWKWQRVLITPKAADHIRELCAALQDGVNVIHLVGIEEGQNLLKQLALGQISNEQFDGVDRAERVNRSRARSNRRKEARP